MLKSCNYTTVHPDVSVPKKMKIRSLIITKKKREKAPARSLFSLTLEFLLNHRTNVDFQGFYVTISRMFFIGKHGSCSLVLCCNISFINHPVIIQSFSYLFCYCAVYIAVI